MTDITQRTEVQQMYWLLIELYSPGHCETARKYYCDRLQRPFTLSMSLCYHGLGFFLGADNSNRKEGLFAKKKKKVEMAVLYDLRITVPDFRHH